MLAAVVEPVPGLPVAAWMRDQVQPLVVETGKRLDLGQIDFQARSAECRGTLGTGIGRRRHRGHAVHTLHGAPVPSRQPRREAGRG